MVFISFGGLTKAASVAEEVKNPKKNIPLGMIMAFITVILLYGLTIFVTVGLLNEEKFAHSLIPLSLGGEKIFGNPGMIAMAVAAILAFVSTGNAGILSASRFPVAMSRDQLLPDLFSKIGKKYHTPYVSILFTGISMVMIILFLDLENLVKIASSMQLLLFMFVLLSHIIMRESKILNYRPSFFSPLYPWIQIIGIISYLFFLFEMGWIILSLSALFIISCIFWHKLYVRGEVMRKSALLHLMEHVVAKEMTSDSLSEELKEILRERDIIREDRFDSLVSKCEIIDIEEEIEMEDFFRLISEKLSMKLSTDKNRLYRDFILREKEMSTVVKPGIAIPHIIVEGNHKFELLIIRNEAGILFDKIHPPVYCVFVIAGSMDERSYHLHSLSAIAQIVRDRNFDRDWLIAKSKEELREIILFSKRYRRKKIR
jgi:amino acid transporter